MLAIILVCQFQDRFVRQLTQPNDRTADQLIIPLAASHQPRMTDTSQVISGGKIDHDLGVRMILQIAGRNGIANLALNGLSDNASLILAPSHQDHAAGVHHRRDTHRDDTCRDILLRRERTGSLLARSAFQQDHTGTRADRRSTHVEHDIAGVTDT